MYLLDLSGGRRRLGGSALAQCYSQLGDCSPDVDDAELLGRGFNAVQAQVELLPSPSTTLLCLCCLLLAACC